MMGKTFYLILLLFSLISGDRFFNDINPPVPIGQDTIHTNDRTNICLTGEEGCRGIIAGYLFSSSGRQIQVCQRNYKYNPAENLSDGHTRTTRSQSCQFIRQHITSQRHSCGSYLDFLQKMVV